jgi:hypothetical protein
MARSAKLGCLPARCCWLRSPARVLSDQRVTVVAYAGLLGAFAFELEPVGATLAELLGGESEDGVAQEQQQAQRQHEH